MYIKIKLTGNSSRENFPLGKIFINQHLLFDGMLKNTVNLNFNVDEKYLRETNVLSIEHYGKNNRDTVVDKDNNIIEDKSIELIKLQINDVLIYFSDVKISLYEEQERYRSEARFLNTLNESGIIGVIIDMLLLFIPGYLAVNRSNNGFLNCSVYTYFHHGHHIFSKCPCR